MTNYASSQPNERITEVVKASKQERQRILQDVRRRRATTLAQKHKAPKYNFIRFEKRPKKEG